MNVKIEERWKEKLKKEFEKPYFESLTAFVREEYKNHVVYPPGKEIFSAFDRCPYDKVKVVVIGQDPYHGKGQAHGLCFSVNENIKMPPSLVNIFKEIKDDLGVEVPIHGNLENWAKQGVLLLNAILTVRTRQPGSHQNKGWETFTDAAIRSLSENRENLVFLLWGSYAQRKGAVINQSRHLVLESAHPSPFSAHRGFFGNRHFSKANAYLMKHNIEPIRW